MWLLASTAPPEVGTCSPPCTSSLRPKALNETMQAAMTGGYTKSGTPAAYGFALVAPIGHSWSARSAKAKALSAPSCQSNRATSASTRSDTCAASPSVATSLAFARTARSVPLDGQRRAWPTAALRLLPDQRCRHRQRQRAQGKPHQRVGPPSKDSPLGNLTREDPLQRLERMDRPFDHRNRLRPPTADPRRRNTRLHQVGQPLGRSSPLQP